MTTLKEKIVIMLAYEAGVKTIECQHVDDTLQEWQPAAAPLWDWYHYNYRVAKTKFVARVPLSTCHAYRNHPPAPNTPVAVVSWEE